MNALSGLLSSDCFLMSRPKHPMNLATNCFILGKNNRFQKITVEAEDAHEDFLLKGEHVALVSVLFLLRHLVAHEVEYVRSGGEGLEVEDELLVKVLARPNRLQWRCKEKSANSTSHSQLSTENELDKEANKSLAIWKSDECREIKKRGTRNG